MPNPANLSKDIKELQNDSLLQIEQVSNRHKDDVSHKLQNQIEEHPTNISSYLELIRSYSEKNELEKAREVFNKLHEKFPLLSFLWTIHLNYELDLDEFNQVEMLLAKCLSGDWENNDLSLWNTYLDYIRRKNNLITGGEEARYTVLKAFDVVLEKCASFEPRSAWFWNDYIQFMDRWKPINKWEEQQRIDLSRKLYKTLLCLPIDSLETIWEKYTQWEQDSNPLTARKYIGELSASYMNARSLYQEWSHITKGLKRSLPTKLVQATEKNLPILNSYDTSQLDIWKNWIEWELQNKLELPEDKWRARVSYTYKQAIQNICFLPEIWYSYSMYDTLNTRFLLQCGVQCIPDSASLTFKLSETFEKENQLSEMESCFQRCIDQLILNLELFKDDNENFDPESSVNSLRRKLTFIYCVYMNTMKRVSGLSSARKVFGKCRKLKKILTHEIYIENAYLEYYSSGDYKTACKVLELGLKFFDNDGEYINKYFDFLILINQDSQIKSLFETSINKILDLNQLKIIYKKVINYESKFGNLNNVYSLEQRFFEKFPHLNKIEIFSDRYQIQNRNFIKVLELTYLNNDELPDIGSFGKNSKRSLNLNDSSEESTNKKQKHDDDIPSVILELLKVLPKHQYFKTVVLDPHKLVDFLSDKVVIPETLTSKQHTK